MVTGNREYVRSVQFFGFEGKVFLGASGDSDRFEVFDVLGLDREAALGKSCLL